MYDEQTLFLLTSDCDSIQSENIKHVVFLCHVSPSNKVHVSGVCCVQSENLIVCDGLVLQMLCSVLQAT